MNKILKAAVLICLACAVETLAATKEEEALKSLQKAEGTVRILCSPGLQTIPAGIAKLIGMDNPALRIKVESMENKDIEAELSAGRASLALVDAMVVAPSAKLSLKPLAFKGLLFAVNASSGFANIPMPLLDKTIAGKISDWSELGMPKGPLRIYTIPDRLPKEFEPQDVPHDEDAEEAPVRKDANGKVIKPKRNRNPFLMRFIPVADEAKALYLVSQDPCGFTISELTAKAPKGVRFLAVDGVQPGKEAFLTGSYPYVRKIQLATAAKANMPEQKIQTLLLSQEFASELLEQGLLPAAGK